MRETKYYRGYSSICLFILRHKQRGGGKFLCLCRNNKMLFVTSSFVGWLIGHILFMKWVGLILVWIQQNNSLRSNKYIRSNKYLVLELRNSMARIYFEIYLHLSLVSRTGYRHK